MAFESLSDKLQNIFKGLRSKGKLTEDDIKAMNEYIDIVSEEINQKRRSLDEYEIEISKVKRPK